MPPSHASSCSDSGSRPGLTSMIQTARGVMTVQTEITGEPARLVTIVDYRGRVLKIWQSSTLADPSDHEEARKWHKGVADEVRESLTRLARRSEQRSSAVGACLYTEAIQAYAAQDYTSARLILDACARLLPADSRVEAARARLHSFV